MKIKILIALSAVTLSLSSCGDQWLGEVKPQNGTLSPNIMFSDVKAVDNVMTGMFDLLKQYSGGRTSARGYNSYWLMYEYRGRDVQARADNIGWPYGFANSWAINPGASATSGYEAAFPWNLFYTIINNANSLIVGVQGSPLTDAQKSAYIAEATALRGWCYFQLSRSYQYSYKHVDPNTALSVPIYTVPANSQTLGNPRSTVAVVFTQILNDLSDDVIAKINVEKPKDKTGNKLDFRLNQDVAYAWRAQVKLEMEDWAGAAADAKQAIGENSSKYPLMSAAQYTSGFNAFNQEWMWGMNFRPDQAFNYDSFFAITDYMGDGYQCFFPNSEFVKLFKESDIRLSLIPKAADLTKGTPLEINPRPEDPNYYLSTKFLARGTSFDGDYIYMRASEMVLIQAECYAKLGQNALAQDALFLIQQRADNTAVKSTNVGEALVEEILIERRKEMFGEIGTDYFDLRRYHRDMNRVGNATFKFEVPATSPIWLLQIPLKEMDSNPNMAGQQNVR